MWHHLEPRNQDLGVGTLWAECVSVCARVGLCVNMYMYVYICVDVCRYVPVDTYVCTRVCVCVYIRVVTCMYVSVCCASVCAGSKTQAHISVHRKVPVTPKNRGWRKGTGNQVQGQI